MPNVLTNDKVDDAPDQTQSENSIAVDPTNPERLVGGYNDCRGFFIASRNGISGSSFSTDGGATWTGIQTGLPKANAADPGSRGDPSIDVDAAGNFYYASLYQRAGIGALNLSVHKGRFTDSTFTWDPPSLATGFTSGFGADKEHLGVDRRPGEQTVYVSYTNFSAPSAQIEVVRSTDGGKTWSAPVVLASGNVQGSVPRVGPDGEIYVAWANWPGLPRSIRIRKSTSWPTFGPEVVAATMTLAANPPFNSRNPQFPSMEIDRTNGPNRGRVYITFDDGRFGGPGMIGTILLVHSPDGSAGSWSAPIRLDDDTAPPSATGTHRWFSWPSVDNRGTVHVGWYDRRLREANPALTDVFATQFRVGEPPEENVRITDRSFSMNVPSRCVPNFGDYNGSAVGPTKFHFYYGDGRLNNPDSFTAGVLTSPIIADPISAEVCRGLTTTSRITVLGGQGLFKGDVALSLREVSPATDTITVTFDPNPVPAPPASGGASTMTISATEETPPRTYRLTVEGTDGSLTETVDVTLVVRSQPPGAPSLLSPGDGADELFERPTFRWIAAEGATTYKVEIFPGDDCTGTPVRVFENISGTQLTVPATQALEFFQRYAWRVTAVNSCGEAVSEQCFRFRTVSCAPPLNFVVNGGFEEDLAGWLIDATVPTPIATTERPRSGAKAAKLGVIAPQGTSTIPGDSEVHQTFAIPADARDASLVFWFWGQSFDALTDDRQEAFVVPIMPPGPPVLLMRVANNQQTYVRQEFNLNPFRGRTIEIHFRATNDGDSNPTGMFLDDVSVTFQGCGPPDFLVRAISPSFNEVCAGGNIDFQVGVESLSGPNFTSTVELSARDLPANTSVLFAKNPIPPGGTTTMTLTTSRPIRAGRYFFDVCGQALEPPPADPRCTRTSIFISSNAPESPETISPSEGEGNVPRRPTFTWTDPFVEDLGPTPTHPSGKHETGNLPAHVEPYPFPPVSINVFGAPRYRIQLARDPEFTDLVIDQEVPEPRFTSPIALAIATQYFWRVNATNACGTSPWSDVSSFVVGACEEGWEIKASIPIANGPAQASVVAAAGKLYSIGGGVGPGPDDRIRQVWEFDPATEGWTRKANVPSPGPGSSFDSAAEFDGKIYVFGGFMGPPEPLTVLNTLWIYEVAKNTWSRGRDLPSPNFGIAVARIGGRIILATGSGFLNQTWSYDPASDSYTRLADAPFGVSRMHADAIGNEMRAFAGGFEGRNHIVYNAATNTWSTGPLMPFGATDPAVVALDGKYYVIGGRPIARTQIFDPATNTWSQGPAVPSLAAGIDNTAGDRLGFTIHLAGGFDGVTGTNAHRAFSPCGPTTAQIIPFAVDGDGTVPEISNERTDLLLTNAVSGATASTTVFLYGPDGTVDSSKTYTVAPNELKSIANVIRDVRGKTGVQNWKGRLNVFGSRPLHAMASIVNNSTEDPSIIEGQPLTGIRNGFVPVIERKEYKTQTVLANLSGRTANVQLLAYPSSGGDTPAASTSVSVPSRGLMDFRDTVGRLGLPLGHFGQLSWNSTEPLAVASRDITLDDKYAGTQPVHRSTDGSRTILLAFAEDVGTYGSNLELNNNGSLTAIVTVRFVDVQDLSGGAPGTSTSRDVPVPVHGATVIEDVIRWVLRDESGKATGKRGLLVVTSPQLPTAQVVIVRSASSDPGFIDGVATGVRSSFTPFIIRLEAKGRPLLKSRVAISNPGTATATVRLAGFDQAGAPAGTLTITLVGNGEFFTEDIINAMGLPSAFVGWMSITSDVPVLVYNQEEAGNGGAVIPVVTR